MLPLPAYATETVPDEIPYAWTILGGNLLNDPMAAKILKNIEISKQRIAELESGIVTLSDKEVDILEQRKIATLLLEQELQQMFEETKAFAPRAAFASFVSKQPENRHDFYWDQFNYLEDKVNFAKQERDKILEDGGSYIDARKAFIELATFPQAEIIWKVTELAGKYGFLDQVAGTLDPDKWYSEEAKTLYASWMNKSADDLVFVTSSLDDTIEESLVNDAYFESTYTSSNGSAELGELYTVSLMLIDDQVPNLQSDATLSFYGDNYVTDSENSVDSISELTLSAWVKPDFSQGSTVYTILSKANAFTLSINNIIDPVHIAKFSVFDGIKWTVVESTSTISEEWTHIAVTLDVSSINIYVNGKLEGTKQIDGIPTLNRYGYLEPSTIETISSEYEILIGAQQIIKRSEVNYQSFFSGLIDEVEINYELLDEQQLSELRHQSEYYSA